MPVDLTKEPLFAEVLARPDDVKPRLVLADRLTERGDPRGEFIHLQCAAVEERDASKARELKERAQKILKKNQPAWLKPIKPYIRSAVFERGFVEHYLAEPPLVFEGLGEVAKHTPLRSLRIQSMKKGNAAQLAKMKELLHLVALDVGSNRIGRDDASALFSSPHLASLRKLEASHNPFGDAAIAALARSPHLGNLSSLRVDDVGGDDGMGRAGIESIASAPFASKLRELSINRAGAYYGQHESADPALLAPLWSAPLDSLERLSIWCWPIGDEGARVIAESPHLGKLRVLRCVGCEIGVEGIRAMLRSTRLPALKYFEPFPSTNQVPADLRAEFVARFPESPQ